MISAPRSVVAVPGLAEQGPAFLCELVAVADRLLVDPDWLAAVMSAESGVQADRVNMGCAKTPCAPDCCAVGLIQFMPTTARALGTTPAALRSMTGLAQLAFVERFYRSWRGRLTCAGDLYLATFMPAALGQPDDFVLGRRGDPSRQWGLRLDRVYEQNAGLDLDRDDTITVGEMRFRLEDYLSRYQTRPRLPVVCTPSTATKRSPGGTGAAATGLLALFTLIGLASFGRRYHR